jgi:RNA methyltransferase, TrmH family
VALIATEAALAKPEVAALVRQARMTPVLVSAGVFGAVVDAATPPGIAAEIALPEPKRDGSSVFLEGVQDAGNVGAIIRSAAAFGVATLITDRQCADAWSPKVLRAGMGGHFAIAIQQVEDLGAAIAAFSGRTICTVVKGGRPLREVELSGRIGWVFGAEGAGLSQEITSRASERVTIAMAGGESLNVAAAAAICFYEVFSRPGGGS